TRVQQFSFDIQRTVGKGFAMMVGYSGSRTANLTWSTATMNLNQLGTRYFTQGSALNSAVSNPFSGKGGTGVIGGTTVAANQLLRPFPQFTSVSFTNSSRNKAQYDAMALRLVKNMSSGLSVVSTYTWSKNFDQAGGGPGNNLNAGNSGPQD